LTLILDCLYNWSLRKGTEMEKTVAIQMQELLARIEDEVSIMKRGDNDCCHNYERRLLDVLDFEKSKIK
jgi:hypothetical protein